MALSESEKVVLIHCIMNSSTNLKDSIDYFQPDYLYLITPTYYRDDKPDYAYYSITNKEIDAFGEGVKKIQNCEIFDIEDAWHENTIIETQKILSKIKKEITAIVGKKYRIIAGLSDAPPLLSVGIAQASIELGFETYYTRGRRTYYNREFVIEIKDIGAVSKVKSWLNSNSMRLNNLRYLKHIVELEEEGEEKVSTTMLLDKISTTPKAMHNALKKLMEYNLIKIDGKRGKMLSSTPLGKYILNTEYNV